ncbi:creatininase family protein [Microbacterium sp. 179-I 3D3 NHS]|uniref:creatininase family protein n=1 Tax=unclassified Microbacterium TaxID=2609290 RepID=UPI0039A0EE50
MTGRSHALATLDRTEIGRRAPGAIAVLPIGATEQHGPHLPTGTDHLVVAHVAERAAELLDGVVDVIVAPTLPFGYSPHHLPFGATISLTASTVLSLLGEACASLLAAGFRGVFILNGHGGNEDLVIVAAREAGTASGAVVGAGSYWSIAWADLDRAGFQQKGEVPGHAGAFETSVMRALGASVDAPRRSWSPAPRTHYHPDFHVESAAGWAESRGFSDDPAAGSAADGERALAVIARAVADALTAFNAAVDTAASRSIVSHEEDL